MRFCMKFINIVAVAERGSAAQWGAAVDLSSTSSYKRWSHMVHSTRNPLRVSVVQYPPLRDLMLTKININPNEQTLELTKKVWTSVQLKINHFWALVQQPHFHVVHDTWRLYNQIDNMTLDKLSRGLYLEDVTGPVRLCHATSCGGLADIQCDTTRGVCVFFFSISAHWTQKVSTPDRYFHNTWSSKLMWLLWERGQAICDWHNLVRHRRSERIWQFLSLHLSGECLFLRGKLQGVVNFQRVIWK